MPKAISEVLKEHILPFNGDGRKVWALNAEVVQMPVAEFAHWQALPCGADIRTIRH